LFTFIICLFSDHRGFLTAPQRIDSTTEFHTVDEESEVEYFFASDARKGDFYRYLHFKIVFVYL
jgi:hypothetical protein